MADEKFDKETLQRLDKIKTRGVKASLHSFDGEAYKDKYETAKAKLVANKDAFIRKAMKEKVGDWSLSKPFNWRRKNAFQK
jgi:non-homologous end joining protein Ku